MNYEEAVAYIEETPKFTTKNKLSHTKECLERLGNPEKKFKVIHVAGTNGKGSTCAFLTSIFREAGYSCGLFTSPHLVVINERFQINEKNIDNQTFMSAFEKVKALADELVAEGSYHPTYFEMLFLMGMVIFAEAGVNYVMLETGLGGRLDATTAVEDPVACVITSISFDHMQYLGNTIAEIAGEKAGIIVPGVPVIYDGNNPEAAKVIRKQAEALGSPYYEVKKETVLPGVIVDGAHNEDGVEKFVETAEHFQKDYPLTLLFSAVDDKDYTDMIRTVAGRIRFQHVIVTQVGGYRKVPAEQLADIFRKEGCLCAESCEDVEMAFRRALEYRGKEGMLFCVGSLYLVGEIKAIIQKMTEH